MLSNNPDPEQAIALFRYGLISPIIFETFQQQNQYFKSISKQAFILPGKTEEQSFSVSTFKSWLANYKKQGIRALKPKKRSDSGTSKVISQAIESKVQKYIEDMPSISAAQIYRNLIKEGHIKSENFSTGTLSSFIKSKQLRKLSQKTPRKKFESAAANQLWMTDFMHGPYLQDLSDHNRKKKTYLCAIIDDHSRLIVGARFFFAENILALATVFKQALAQHGLTKRLYCDNGSAFSTSFLLLVCATLGIDLIHSKPYDSPSRGKIERYFKTVRQMFLPNIDLNLKPSIAQLNTEFSDWLNNQYHKNIHSGINQAPMDRYMDSISHASIIRKSQEELDAAFLNKITRKVKKDSTISINGKLFETPPQYIGSIIDCRHPIDQPDNLTLYIADEPKTRLYPVNLIDNAYTPASGIQFNNKEKN